MRKHGKRIVVFIDDIDRLDRADMQTLFKLVRLSGGFDHTTYVLAFDDAVVAEALGAAYGAGDHVAGRRFLEKIVQVPLHLPAASSDKLRELMFKACDRVIVENKIEMSEDDGSELGTALATGILPALKTPRQVKLFDNAITFAVPLLRGEARVVDQIQIEALRIFYPSVYEAVRKNPDDVLRTRERDGRDTQTSTKVEQAIDKLDADPSARGFLREFLQELFPRFGNGGYGGDWDETWSEQKRACSRAYFLRYFTYTVPSGDFPDLAIDELLAKAGTSDRQATGAIIARAFETRSSERLIEKLRAREKSLDLSAAPILISEISARSADFPSTRDIMFGDLTRRQAAIFIVQLIARLSGEQQAASFTEAVERSASLYFASLLVSVGARKETRTAEGSLLSPELLQPIVDILLRRLREKSAEFGLIEISEGRLGHIAYAIKRNGSEDAQRELKAFLCEFVAASASNALELLKALAGRTQGGNGIITVSDVTRETYESVSGLVEPDQVYQQLLSHYGEDLAFAQWRDDLDDTIDVDRRVANQFSYLHNNPDKGAPAE